PEKSALIDWGWHMLFAAAVRLQVCALRLSDFAPGTRFQQYGLATLCATHGLVHLRHLYLNDSHLDPLAAQALAGSTLTNLTHLQLGRNPLGVAGAVYLAGGAVLENLTHLNLAGTGIGLRGAIAVLV